MRNLLIGLLIAILIYLSYNKIIDVSLNYIIILAVVVILLTYDFESLEHLTNDEVLANVASLYNNQNMTVSNLNVTDKLTVGGKIIIGTFAQKPEIFSKIDGRLNIKVPNSLTVDKTDAAGSGDMYYGNSTAYGNINVSGKIIIGTFAQKPEIFSKIDGRLNIKVPESLTVDKTDVPGSGDMYCKNSTAYGYIKSIGGAIQAVGPTNQDSYVQLWSNNGDSYIQTSGNTKLHLINTDFSAWSNDRKPARSFKVKDREI